MLHKSTEMDQWPSKIFKQEFRESDSIFVPDILKIKSRELLGSSILILMTSPNCLGVAAMAVENIEKSFLSKEIASNEQLIKSIERLIK